MRLARFLWLLPALAALACTVHYASFAPEPVDWRLVWREPPLVYSGDDFFDFRGSANFVAFRAIHLGLLATPADFDSLALVPWLLATGCVLLLRSLGVRGRRPTAVAALLIAAALYSPVFAADWLLLARFRVFGPALCCCMAVSVLRGTGRWRARWVVAALLAQLALFVHVSGALLWLALVPLVAFEARRRGRRALVAAAAWCVVGNLGLLLCYDESTRGLPGLGGHLVEQPAVALATLARVAGLGLPDVLPGTDSDTWVAGAVLATALAVFAGLLVRRRAHDATVADAMPWLSLALFGVGAVVAVSHAMIPLSLADNLLKEICWAGVFLPIGIAGLTVAIAPASFARLLTPAAAALLLLFAQEWCRGLGSLRFEHELLRQGEAQLVFADAALNELPAEPRPPLPLQANRDLLRASGKLRRIEPVPTLAIGELEPSLDSAPAGRLDSVTAAAAKGHVARTDLVLLVRQLENGPGRVFRIAAPNLFILNDTLPWTADLADAEAFRELEEVRAFAFDARARRRRALDGAFRFQDGRFIAIEADAR